MEDQVETEATTAQTLADLGFYVIVFMIDGAKVYL